MAAHRRTSHEDMTFASTPDRNTHQLHQLVAGSLGADDGAGLVVAACAIHLARGDAGEANARSLGTPYRPVAIVDRGWRAGEGLAGRNYDRGQQHRHDHRMVKSVRTVQ